MQSFIVSNLQAGQRFDKFLRKYLPKAQSGFLYKMLRKKNITLNGKKADGSEILAENDVVATFFSDETFQAFRGEESDGPGTSKTAEYTSAYRKLKGIGILYEDEDILVLNKPAGILSQKAKEQDLSLNEWLIGYMLDGGEIGFSDLETFHPSVCNRLDINTSGIVLCGKTLSGLQFLSSIIRDKELKKFYRAICPGKIEGEMTLTGILVKDTGKNLVSIREDQSCENGEKIQGGATVKTRIFPIVSNDRYTYLEVQLFTGKTHQIRAHLSRIGHPVIGDTKYREEKTNQYFRENYRLSHQLLHAYRVEFPEKMQEKFQNRFLHMSNRVIIAEIPANFEDIRQKLFAD